MSFFRKIPLSMKYLFDGDIPLRKKIWVIIGLFYLLSPIDLIPEPVLGLGLIDDFIIITFILNKLSSDLNKYQSILNKRKKEENIKDDIIENVEYDIEDDNIK